MSTPVDSPIDWSALATESKEARRTVIRASLEARGMVDARSVASSLARLIERAGVAGAADRIIELLETAGSPARAAAALEDCLATLAPRPRSPSQSSPPRTAPSRADSRPALPRFATNGAGSPMSAGSPVSPAAAIAQLLEPEVLSLVVELTGASQRASHLLARDPTLAVELAERLREADHREIIDFDDALAHIVIGNAGDTNNFDRHLRRFRHRQMLHIALQEIRGLDVRKTCAELADLAAACFRASLEHHLPILNEEVGRPEPECAHVVVGMGKLGGRELNFSSDIDVIYFYEHDEGMAGELTIHQFHVKLFERAQRSLSQVTEHGFVFRVDSDLRPEGKKGPLANSLASAERYYQTWGRTWERAAWIRARPVAGDMAFGAQVLEMMRPFVYRRTFDLAAVDSIISMKDQIDAARRRSRTGLRGGIDLKLGVGGIREIEFFVQAQQLLHGGKNPRLRDPAPLEGLQRLEAAGIVSSRVAEQLADAYLMLRKVEHRIQIVDEQQTHNLPTDESACTAVARSLGFEVGTELEAALAEPMAAVNEIFGSLHGTARDEEPIPPLIEVFADLDADEEERVEAASELGARHAYTAVSSLDAAARGPGSPFHLRASAQRRRLALQFLVECWSSPSFDRAMRHLPVFIREIVRHHDLVEALANPPLRRGIARVLGASDLLARILVSSPTMVPHVLVPTASSRPSSLATVLADRVRAVDGDVEEGLDVLRSVKAEEILRTAVADLAGVIDSETVGHRMSELAGLLVGEALTLAMGVMTERYGEPKNADGTPAQVAVVSGGTLGAFELGYRSDLDLSFVFVGDGKTTGGTKGQVGCPEYFTRVMQRLLQFLTLRTARGDLYPVDMRLRPSGNQGALVVRLEKFISYHGAAAQLWERQALVRSRAIAGDRALCAEVDAAIHAAAYRGGPTDGIAAGVRDMRERLRKEQRRVAPHTVDLKMGRGGLADIEFLVQGLLLVHGPGLPQLRTTSTRAALRGMAEAGILPQETADGLLRAHTLLRKVLNWLRIAHDEMLDRIDLEGLDARPLALAVGYQGEDAQAHMARDLVSDTDLIHNCYTSYLS